MTDSDLAETTAQILLDTGCVLFRPQEPFFFSSGWASPVFVNVKRLISFPLARNKLIDLAVRKILDTVGYAAFDVIAGGEVAGIPFAAMVADRLNLPLVIVRKQAKGYGPKAQIEGALEGGKRVLLVEDLTTDGRTKALFCDGLRRGGAEVKHAFVIFKYGIFDYVVRDLDVRGLELFSLATWDDLMRVARARGAMDAAMLKEIEAYIADPIAWSEIHGGAGPSAAPSPASAG
jgi:orotate phosphoribosyltransferase